MRLFHKFYPDEYLESTYSIDFQQLYNEGYRGILFDIDNTLVPHGVKADERSKNLMKKLKGMGFRICLISNNQKERVTTFNDDVKVNFIYDAHKPSRRGYIKAMKTLKTDTTNTVFVGDQLFTDVYGAKRTGLRTILVKPIHPKEEIQIVFKRYLEKVVLYFYLRNKKK